MMKVESNQESFVKDAEIKAFFAEVEEMPFGHVLSLIFKSRTKAESWEIKRNIASETIYGRGKLEGGEESVIALRRYTPVDFDEGLNFQVFKNRASAEEEKEDLSIFTTKISQEDQEGIIRKGYDLKFWFSEGSFSLTSKYDRWLTEIITRVVWFCEERTHSVKKAPRAPREGFRAFRQDEDDERYW